MSLLVRLGTTTASARAYYDQDVARFVDATAVPLGDAAIKSGSGSGATAVALVDRWMVSVDTVEVEGAAGLAVEVLTRAIDELRSGWAPRTRLI